MADSKRYFSSMPISITVPVAVKTVVPVVPFLCIYISIDIAMHVFVLNMFEIFVAGR